MAARTEQTVLNIHGLVRERIITGHYAPEEPLSQLPIAEELGVSRTPVREAFRLLEQEGLLIAEHNKRFRVASFSPADLEDLYVLRIAVESAAIRLSVPQIEEENLTVLRSYIEAMDAAIATGSYDAWRDPHHAFHELLLIHAGYRARSSARDLSVHAERYRYAVTLPESPISWAQSHQDHWDLFDSASKHDGDRASQQISLHYGRVALSYLSFSAPLYDPRMLRVTLDSVDASSELSSGWSRKPRYS
ncbi:GntR family transcriptional regulator [Leucobacter japonicus]|uniref:GntR family transcriptional regulator n=1 Tax=Leucobacter japonicus TaxID=1461259 RepID=UPI0006A7ABD6|nr:GntR family transcriptional regulator [Leucobacter japonicus]